MTFIARDEHPCVKCDTPECEEHYMWPAKDGEMIRLADHGWLDVAVFHYCPTHRQEMERRATETINRQIRREKIRTRLLIFALAVSGLGLAFVLLYFTTNLLR